MKHIYDWFDRGNAIAIPHHYGLAYSEFMRACDVYYPIPINLVVRYGLRLYWNFLRAFYWVGVIDTNIAECFRWDDFWRISRR